MTGAVFRTESGLIVPAVTAEEMREVDRIATQVFGLEILQMMENAGRGLARSAMDMVADPGAGIAVLAGRGGNGGGGLCCARHLRNHGYGVQVILTHDAKTLTGAVQNQLRILMAAGVLWREPQHAEEILQDAALVVDALIGYSLRGAPRGQAAALIELCNRQSAPILSLDLPSGLDATTGDAPGVVVPAQRTVTLALPKVGLKSFAGELHLADIGIPPQVYRSLGVHFEPFFGKEYCLRLFAG